MERFGLDFSILRVTLSNRNFAMFTAGNVVSLMGTWLQRVSVGWLTWNMTKSGTWLGAVSMAEFLPVIFLAPLTGVMADRFDRRRIAVFGQAFALVQAALLAGLTLSGFITPLLILLLQVLSGIVQPLIQTARLVLVPTLLPRENVGHAVAITSLTFNIARIVGPALAGVLITTVGVGYSFALNAASYIGVIVALTNLRLPPVESAHTPMPTLAVIWSDMVEGWRYTFQHPTLRWLMPLVLVASTLMWPLGDLMAGIADHQFGRGAAGLAVLMSAQGVGAICGGLFLAHRRRHDDLYLLLTRALIVSGVLLAIFATLRSFWVAVPVLALNSTFGVLVGAGSQTIAQTSAEDRMRGRTLSVWYIITRFGPAVGALGIGSLASLVGFTLPLVAAGLISSAAAMFFLIRWRAEQALKSAG